MVGGVLDFFQPSTIAEEIGSLWPQNHRLCFGFSFQLTRSSFAGFLITATSPNMNHQGACGEKIYKSAASLWLVSADLLVVQARGCWLAMMLILVFQPADNPLMVDGEALAGGNREAAVAKGCTMCAPLTPG